MLVEPEEDLDVSAEDSLDSRQLRGTANGLVDTKRRAAVCVLYFHPNGCDIGQSIPEMEIICDLMFSGSAVVVAPEYPGYGLLTGYEPTPSAIDRIAEGAWEFCSERLGFRADEIVLWGRSIGTGPASALARTLAHPQAGSRRSTGERRSVCACAALVLVAPFVSVSAAVSSHAGSIAASLVCPMWEVAGLVADRALVDVPLCVIHPEQDEIVPLSHAEKVLAAASACRKLGVFLAGETHNFDWEETNAEPVRDFLEAHVLALQQENNIPQETFHIPDLRPNAYALHGVT